VAAGVGLSKRDIPAAVTLQFAPLAASKCDYSTNIHNMQVMHINIRSVCYVYSLSQPPPLTRNSSKSSLLVLIGTTLEQNHCHEAPELQTHLQLTDDSGFEYLKYN